MHQEYRGLAIFAEFGIPILEVLGIITPPYLPQTGAQGFYLPF